MPFANSAWDAKRHPGFAGFEQTHPGVQQFQNHPRKFMNREENHEDREQR